jgi:hypothetical protein
LLAEAFLLVFPLVTVPFDRFLLPHRHPELVAGSLEVLEGLLEPLAGILASAGRPIQVRASEILVGDPAVDLPGIDPCTDTLGSLRLELFEPLLVGADLALGLLEVSFLVAHISLQLPHPP